MPTAARCHALTRQAQGSDARLGCADGVFAEYDPQLEPSIELVLDPEWSQYDDFP